MSDSDFFSDSDGPPEETPRATSKKSNRKHAPKEASSKERVSTVREIPGLKTKNTGSLYRDIRFDAAYGDVNYTKIRHEYKFLDDYRDKEIKETDKILHDKKLLDRMSEREVEDLKYRNKSLKSRMEHFKKERFEGDAIKKYKQESGKKWLKDSDKRKVLRVARFESMSGRQRKKAMERKRKRKLGKEMKTFAFSREE